MTEDEMKKVNLWCVAGRGTAPGQVTAAAFIDRDSEPGIAPLKLIVPPKWDRKLVQVHLLPCDDIYLDASHLAIFEYQDGTESHPVYFGDHRIDGAWILVGWNAGQYRWLHCIDCASEIAQWVSRMQGVWGNAYKTVIN